MRIIDLNGFSIIVNKYEIKYIKETVSLESESLLTIHFKDRTFVEVVVSTESAEQMLKSLEELILS